jgi:capsid protein
LNWLDRCIGFVSPSWGWKREAWRTELKRFYDAGDTDRLNSGWVSVNATAEQTDKQQRDIIRARARDLERNSDISEAIIGPFERNVVGNGIRLQAKVMKDESTEDEELNQQIEELWKEWCRARNCDVTGQQSFQEMQQMAIRRLLVDGGIIFIKAYTKGGTVPLSLQAKEVDELDTSKNEMPGLGRNRVITAFVILFTYHCSSSDGSSRNLFLYKNRKAGVYAFLNRYGFNELIDVTYPRKCLSQL